MGPLNLESPLMQAGLAGYSDRAMRLVARRRGCPYAVTEAILDRTLLAGGKGLANAIDINDEDHPVAGQIMGSEPSEVAAAARLMAGYGYDVIDLNFACPVKKVKNKARGGWMLADVERGVSMLRAVREALPARPLSLSLRRGFDDTAESEERFWRLCEEAHQLEYVAVRVHGRTVEQKYAGRSRRPFLAEVKRAFPDWIVWGSGDVFEPQDVVEMLVETGVDGVWIARGAIGNPWIFRDAMRLLRESRREPQMDTDEHRFLSLEGQGPRVDQGDDDGHRGVDARLHMLDQQATEPPAPRRGSYSQSPGQRPGSAGPTNLQSPEGAPPPGCGLPALHNIRVHLCSSVASSLIPPPTVAEQREALGEHFDIAMQIHGESLAGRRMRKIGIKYARFHPAAADVKKRFIAVRSLADWQAVLDDFYGHDGPGVRPPREAVDEVNDVSCDPQEVVA